MIIDVFSNFSQNQQDLILYFSLAFPLSLSSSPSGEIYPLPKLQDAISVASKELLMVANFFNFIYSNISRHASRLILFQQFFEKISIFEAIGRMVGDSCDFEGEMAMFCLSWITHGQYSNLGNS